MIDSMTTLAAMVPAVAAMAAVYLSFLTWSNSASVYGKVTVTDTKKVVFFGTVGTAGGGGGGGENAKPSSAHCLASFPASTIVTISAAVLSQTAVIISDMLEHFGS